jgi:ribosomal protein L33
MVELLMKYCPSCGKAGVEAMKFCPQCGQKLIGLHSEKKQTSTTRPEAPLTENSTMETGQHRLGSILYTHGTEQICEGGVCDDKKSILWDEVDFLFLDASKTTVNFVPAGESMKVRVISTTTGEISFTQGAFFRIGSKDKSNFWNMYQFMVLKVIDRQWSKLLKEIGEGKRVTFTDFDVSSSAIYRKKFFGGYDVIELGRIAGCNFANGELFIDFVDDKRRLKRKSLGRVPEIPNIHLAQAFLSSIAQHNLHK